MRNKKFKCLLFFVLVLVFSMSCIEFALADERAEPIKIVGSTMTPPDFFYYQAMLRFKSLLDTYYSGPLDIELFNSGVLGTEEDSVAYMIEGKLVDFAPIAPIWIGSWSKKAPFINIPYLWRDIDHVKKALKMDIFKEIEDELQKKGLMIVSYLCSGVRNICLNKPITTIDELSKLKIRQPEIGSWVRVFKGTGLNVVTVSYAEVYNAIRQGVADGQEVESSDLLSSSYWEVNPYVLSTHSNIMLGVLLFSKKRFQSFSKELQDAILKAGRETGEWSLETQFPQESQILLNLIDEGKVIYIPFKGAKELRERAQPIIEEIAKEMGLEDVYKKIRSIK